MPFRPDPKSIAGTDLPVHERTQVLVIGAGPAGLAAADFVRRRIDAYARGRSVAAVDAAPVHDALCVAYLVQPDVITTRSLHVAVETEGSLTVGRTVMDTRPQASTPPNCDVAFDADAAAFVAILEETLARGGAG